MPILFGVVLLDLIGFGIVIPILPFLSPRLGADKMDIALVIVSYAACSGLFGDNAIIPCNTNACPLCAG